MLESVELDGLIVATPTPTHAGIVSDALEHGVPVLVEKPLTIDLAEARVLRDQVVRFDGFVMIDHIHLFSPAYRALKQQVKATEGPFEITGRAGNIGPFRDDTPALWDWGPHDLAMCIDLTGEVPSRVTATETSSTVVDVDGHDADGKLIEIDLKFPGGTNAHLVVGNIMHPKTRLFEVKNSYKRIIYDDMKSEKLCVEQDGRSQMIVTPTDKPLDILVAEFADEIVGGKRGRASLDLGIRVVEVLDACQRSVATHAPIELSGLDQVEI